MKKRGGAEAGRAFAAAGDAAVEVALSGGWSGDWQRGVLRRLTGKSEGMAGDASAGLDESGTPENALEPDGRDGVAMRFGQWGGLRVLMDLRVGVVG